jgi:hypothetical protein
MVRKLLLTLLLLGGLQAQAQIPTSDLIFGALYDNNLNVLNTTTSTDVVVSGIPGTVSPAGATYTSGINGVSNTAISFDTADGSTALYYASYNDNYLTTPLINTSLPDMTFSAWVKSRIEARNSADFPTIFAWGDHTQERIALFLQPLTGINSFPAPHTLGFVVSRFGRTVARPPGSPPSVSTGPIRVYTSLDSVRVIAGQWNHVLVRFRGVGSGNNRVMEYEAFLNGVSTQTGSNNYFRQIDPIVNQRFSDSLANFQINSTPRFTVGGILDPQSSTNPLNLFGSIDNLRLYKRYLNDTEVAALFAERTQNPTAVDPGTQITFRAYPNPAAENLNLEMDQPLGGTLRILDVSGRVLQTTLLPAALNHTVDVSHLTSGLYIAQLNGATLRFMKQ